jgi:hypothetical protein
MRRAATLLRPAQASDEAFHVTRHLLAGQCRVIGVGNEQRSLISQSQQDVGQRPQRLWFDEVVVERRRQYRLNGIDAIVRLQRPPPIPAKDGCSVDQENPLDFVVAGRASRKPLMLDASTSSGSSPAI